MQRIHAIFLIAIALAAACKQKQQEVKPQVKQLTEAVYASGTLVPEEEYKVVSTVEGYLTKAAVKEGDTVKLGQLLFTLGSNTRRVQEQTAEAIVARTLPVVANESPAISELEGRIEISLIRLQNDSVQYVRYKNLYEQNAISKSNYEKYQLQYESSQKELNNLQHLLHQQRLSSALELQRANNQLALSRAEVSNGILKSFTDGVVYDIYKKEGDLVTPNQPVALIGRGKMIARLLVDEDDLDKVKEGQKVMITMDAYPDKVFKATVQRIYPMLNKIDQSFRVDAILIDQIPTGIYGLNIEANIVIKENEKVLVVPKKAILPGDSLLVSQDGKEEKIKVRKGIEDKEWVEVTKGISDKTLIIIRP